jgi:hypothetical protein
MRHLQFLVRTIIAALFAFTTRLFYRIEVHGLENDPRTPHTYLAISHKRDLDAIVSIPPVFFHRGRRALAGGIHFALRADTFEKGYLARMVPRPRWLSHLLYPISVGPVLKWLGAYPIEELSLRSASEWVRKLLRVEGNVQVGDVFTPAFLHEMADVVQMSLQELAVQHLSSLLHWRYHQALLPFYGEDILLEPVRRRVKRHLLQRIKQELGDLGAWLSTGGSLFTSPEGRLSPTGTLSPITSGLHRLLRLAPPDMTILPISITYDFMTTHRPAIFIDVASPITLPSTLPAHELDTQMHKAWKLSAPFTCTQIGSGFLVQANRMYSTHSAFTLEDVVAYVCQQAFGLAQAGRHVDPRLLHCRRARKRVKGFLAYAERHGLIQRIGPLTWEPVPGDSVIKVRIGETGYALAPLAYAWNELQDMLNINI